MPISGSRLDLLMNLTGTSNGELGKALNFDTSYISRIRSGKRGIPRHQPFVEPAAGFFADKLSGDTMLRSVAAFLISPDTPWPADLETAAARIAGWLRFDIGDGYRVVEEFLRIFSTTVLPSCRPICETLPLPMPETTGFLGNEGKRQAMELLVNDMVSRTEDPGQLLFYSDEDLTWLTEDRAYFEQWKQKVICYLLHGGKICLIHTANRELSEVFTEMEFFMPFYLCGNVEPYYCPVLLDGIFRRTMCIYSGRRAIAGQSIGEDTARSTSFLITHSDTLRAMEYDYRRFLSMCKPVMRIIGPGDACEIEALHSYFRQEYDIIHAGRTPMLGTLPEAALKSMEQRSTETIQVKQIRRCISVIMEKLGSGISVTEVLNLPSVTDIRSGLVPLAFSASLGFPNMSYTPAELRMQLIHVVELMEQFPNYHVILSARLPENVDILAAEEAALLARLGTDGKAFFFPMNRAVTALWKYLDLYTGRENRESVIRTMNEMIFELGNCGMGSCCKSPNRN